MKKPRPSWFFDNLTPRERWTPSEWSEKAPIHIPDNGINPEPGPYRNSRTPYLREIIDLAADTTVREIWVHKATQVGFTRMMMNFIGYCVDMDPGALGLLMPDELSAGEILAEELKPTLEQTPALKRHVSGRPWDNKTNVIKTDTMPIFALWAGSVQRLARRSLRRVIGDEINKYKRNVTEANPIDLVLKRVSNWEHRGKAIMGSTPTTRDGAVTIGLESCPDKRYLHWPCPHCKKYRRVAWEQVKWEKVDLPDKQQRANAVKLGKLAWYECVHCKARIDEHHKPGMNDRCKWASEGQSVADDGSLIGERPPAAKVGYQLTSIISPWLKFWDLAAEFIEAEGDYDKTRDFRNARLAEPFETQIANTQPSMIRDKAKDGPNPLIVPAWAQWLIATADTQGNNAQTGWFPYVVRAWGYGYRSQRIDAGIASTFEELKAWTLDKSYQMDGRGLVQPQNLLIDTGGPRFNEVYQFCLSDQRIVPTKGAAGAQTWPVSKSYQKDRGVVLWLIDTEQTKDMLNRLIHDPDQTKWTVDAAADETYCAEMASEHKVIDPKTKRQIWVKKTSGSANHFWDCEANQCAAAIEVGAGLEEPAPRAQRDDKASIPASQWLGGSRKW